MAGILHIELGLTLRVYVILSLVVVSDFTCARVENDTRHAWHTGIAYAHLSGTTYLRLHGRYKPCRSLCEEPKKNHRRFLGLEHAKFSLYEKFNNCRRPYRPVSTERKKSATVSEYTPGLDFRCHGRDINCTIHAFVRSFVHLFIHSTHITSSSSSKL